MLVVLFKIVYATHAFCTWCAIYLFSKLTPFLQHISMWLTFLLHLDCPCFQYIDTKMDINILFHIKLDTDQNQYYQPNTPWKHATFWHHKLHGAINLNYQIPFTRSLVRTLYTKLPLLQSLREVMVGSLTPNFIWRCWFLDLNLRPITFGERHLLSHQDLTSVHKINIGAYYSILNSNMN